MADFSFAGSWWSFKINHQRQNLDRGAIPLDWHHTLVSIGEAYSPTEIGQGGLAYCPFRFCRCLTNSKANSNFREWESEVCVQNNQDYHSVQNNNWFGKLVQIDGHNDSFTVPVVTTHVFFWNQCHV